MKHILLIFYFVIIISGRSHANDKPIPTPMLHSFYSTFTDAQDVRWEQSGKLTLASFILHGKKKFAYYNDLSELIIVADPIALEELPETLRESVHKSFGRYMISEIFKLKDAQGISYHIILASPKEKLFVKSNGRNWEVEKDVRK